MRKRRVVPWHGQQKLRQPGVAGGHGTRWGAVTAIGWTLVLLVLSPSVHAVSTLAAHLSAAGSLATEPLTLRCPGRVRTLAAQAGEGAAPGFVAALPPQSLTYLTGVVLQEGPADRRTDLTPERIDGRLVWMLEAQSQQPSVVCRYEGGVALSRPLPAHLRQCVSALSATASKLPEGTGIEKAVTACR